MTAGGDVLDIKGNDDHDVCLKLHFSNESKGFKPKQKMDLFWAPRTFKK